MSQASCGNANRVSAPAGDKRLTAQTCHLTYLIWYGYIHAVWEVYEHRRVIKQLASLPLEILKRYEKWKDIAMVSGLAGLRLIKGFHDEALQGEWKEHRSSRLGLQYRVIYKMNAKDRIFQVISITPHDYRRM